MTRILLLRHGHVAGIVPKRFRGRLDLPLSDEGRAQAAQAASYVAQHYTPEAIYSSPLQRCLESAGMLAARLALPMPNAAQGLIDTDYGQWQGRLATEVEHDEPELFAQWRNTPDKVLFPQGESLARVAQRAMTELKALAHKHRGRTIAVYSHDSVIRTLLLVAIGAPLATYHRLEVDPCSLSELCQEPDGALEIVRINERTG